MEETFERKISDKVLFKRLLQFVKPFWVYFAVSLLIIAVSVPLSLLNPMLIQQITDILMSGNIVFSEIMTRVIYMIIILVVNAFSIYFMFYLLQKAGQKINCHIRAEVFKHIEGLSTNQFNNIPVGKLVSRVTNDSNAITQMFTNVIIGIFRNGLTAIISLTYMLILNWKLTLIAITTIPILFVCTLIYQKASRPVYRNIRTFNTDMNAYLSEHLSGVKVTQLFNRQDSEYKKFAVINGKLKTNFLRLTHIFGIFRPALYALYVISLSLVFYFGGLDGINMIITGGIVLAFYEYLRSFFDPIQQLSEQTDILQSAFASAEKIFSILDTVPEVVDNEGAVELTDLKGDIEFKNVWFSYVPDEWVLKDVSFKINANETVAFVGETGSGKTTILSLITRNYDIQKGQILIDGIDVRQIKLDSLRGNISQMLQDVFLFSGTVESNIKLRDNDAFTEEEMIEASKYVNAHQFISKLRKGYQDEVYERGNNFSAGQRQLLSFVRAVLHKPRIIILDEATANIDTETEILIQESLEKMMNIGTMLVVAHRLSTVQNADKIILLDHGQIIESGTHHELLTKHGRYYQLYLLQFADKDTDSA
jgi:ATP-binding cassette subfamily B protein